jgi:hypothetical protein
VLAFLIRLLNAVFSSYHPRPFRDSQTLRRQYTSFSPVQNSLIANGTRLVHAQHLPPLRRVKVLNDPLPSPTVGHQPLVPRDTSCHESYIIESPGCRKRTRPLSTVLDLQRVAPLSRSSTSHPGPMILLINCLSSALCAVPKVRAAACLFNAYAKHEVDV